MKRGKTEPAISDISDLLRPYHSGWVALSRDERTVVTAGRTLKETLEQAAERGCSQPVFCFQHN